MVSGLGIGLRIMTIGQTIKEFMMERKSKIKSKRSVIIGKYFTSVYRFDDEGRFKSKKLYSSEGNFLTEFEYTYDNEEDNNGLY